MTALVSRLIRLAIMERFTLSFNDLLTEACQECGIPAYQIDFDGTTGLQNFYEGNRTLGSLNLMQEPDLPAMTMWTGEGGQYPPGQRSMPAVFSGFVMVHWRFFLSVKGLRTTGLIELREATESAMLAVIDDEFSGFNYRGDLAWQPLNEQAWVDQDKTHRYWTQELEFAAGFEVNL